MSDYLSLNVQLAQRVTKDVVWHDGVKVEDTITAYRADLRTFLKTHAVADEVLDILFVEETLITRQYGDQAYLEWLLTYKRNDLAGLLVKRYLDFYQLEYCLRRGRFPMVQGGFLQPLIATPDTPLPTVLAKSDYSKRFAIIDARNALKLFDECLYQDMAAYQHVGIGLDGVIAKVMVILLQLKQAKIIEQGRRSHLDTQKIVRDYHG